jgi:hypothetical protein
MLRKDQIAEGFRLLGISEKEADRMMDPKLCEMFDKLADGVMLQAYKGLELILVSPFFWYK